MTFWDIWPATPVAGTILQDVVVLKRPSPDSLAEVLLKPLFVGFSYEELSMVDSMLESVEREVGCLSSSSPPERCGITTKSWLLTRAEYERIGEEGRLPSMQSRF